jgi:outer membrane autotransporter protein
MQRLEVQQGTLRLMGGYAMAPTGTFQTKVYTDGSNGQLAVTGTARLGGTLQILRGPGIYRNGTTYDILEATQGISGAFANLLPPEPTPLLRFDVHQLPNTVEVQVHAPSVTTVATNPHHQRIAEHLDTIMPTATGDLASVLGAFQALPAAGFNRAFASLSPASYDSSTRATYEGAWQYTQSLRRRLEAVRAASTGAIDTRPAQPVLLAALESDAQLLPLLGAYHVAQPQAQNGLWLNGFGEWGDQEATPGFSGFRFGTGGATLGYDHTFQERLTTGLSLGYAHTDVNLGDNAGTGRIQSLSGSLYGSYFTPHAYVEGAASYLHNWYDNERQLVIGTLARTATSKHEADAGAVYLGAGYSFPFGAWGLGPVGALRYVYLAEAGFQETGADALNLQVAHRGTHSLVSELGLRLTGLLATRYGTWLPEVGAAWSYDFAVDDRLITSAYAGAPNAAFSVAGQPLARHGALTRAGLTLAPTHGWSLSLRYTGEFRDAYQSHGVLGEVRVSF